MKVGNREVLGIGPTPDIISKAQQSAINNFKSSLRKRITPAEEFFRLNIANRLRKRTDGCVRHAFQREFFIATGITFIVDFHFRHFKTVVEIDGAQHYSEEGLAKDRWRADLLRTHHGIETVHFENKKVLNEPEKVWDEVINVLLSSKTAHQPSLQELRRLNDKGLLSY